MIHEYYQGDKQTIMLYLEAIYKDYQTNSDLYYKIHDTLDGGRLQTAAQRSKLLPKYG